MEAGHPYDALLGPFYDVAGVADLLRVTEHEVHLRCIEGTILWADTMEGTRLFPTLQFTAARTVDPRLVPCVQALRDVDPWARAQWVTMPNPDLDDATPLAWAREDRDPDRLLASARRTSVEWGRG